MSAPMVCAILEGRKTQTRRVCTPTATMSNESRSKVVCPYGEVGDHLWVRETFTLQCDADGEAPPFHDGRPLLRGDPEYDNYTWIQPHYRSTDLEPELSCENIDCRRQNEPHCHWASSIHMPRWASRITLEIVDLRVERVQEIGEQDAIAEGLSECNHGHGVITAARCEYIALWESLNAKRGYGWAVNPWVWVIEFQRQGSGVSG